MLTVYIDNDAYRQWALHTDKTDKRVFISTLSNFNDTNTDAQRYLSNLNQYLQSDSTVFLNMPEYGLFGYYLAVLSELLTTTSADVVVMTQSANLLDLLPIKCIRVCHIGKDPFNPMETIPHIDRWLERYGPGQLWAMGLFGRDNYTITLE